MTTSKSSDNNNSISNANVFQNSVYIGMNIQNILYGIGLLLYFKTMVLLLAGKMSCSRSRIFYACFSTMMIFLVSVWVAAEVVFGQKMWLSDANFPGGPTMYWKINSSNWYMDWGTTAMITLQLMTDGLMIHRCRLIWNSYRFAVIPIVLWLVCLILGSLVDWVTSVPGGDYFSGIATQLMLSYYTVSVFLNTALTCLICYRIIRHGREVQKHVGREHASMYFSVATIVVESAFPYTLSGIACLVSLGIGSSTSVAFVGVYVLMMCISPQVLILRVVAGTAWDKDTVKPMGSSVRFSVGEDTSASLRCDMSGPSVQTISGSYHPDGYDKA